MRKNPPSPKTGPLFSVIVPLYNKRPYLQRSLGSILGQTVRDFKLLVIDDGSTDGGGEAVAAFKDKRIRLIRQENAGVSAARNLGVAQARGKYVTFLDADDEWDGDYLATLKDLIRDFPGAGLYATNYRVHDGKHRVENAVPLPAGWRGRLEDFYHLTYQTRMPFHTSSVCLPRVVAKQNPFPEGIKAGEDIYVWFRVCLEHELVYFNRSSTVWYLQTTENAHDSYFGSAFHLDWLAIGRRLGAERRLSESAEKFITWCTLMQMKKMILQGHRLEALNRWWHCPRKYFPFRQAALLLLAFSPVILQKGYRRVFRKYSTPPPFSAEKAPVTARPAGTRRKKAPFFSVVVPVYNKKDYLRRSVGSVLGQTFRDFELIVVDDGSKDGSPAVVKSFRDKRIRLIVQKNAGVSAARNRGISAARGSYVAFLDADDDWDKGYLQALRGLIEEFPGAGLYGTNYWVDNGIRKEENPALLPVGWRGRMRDYYDLTYYGRPPFCTNTICLPATLARQIPFPVGIKAGEDLLVWFKASLGHDTVYWNKPFSTYYLAATDNTHATYFGSQYHLDWLTLGEELKKEGPFSKGAEKYVVWAALIQARKMIGNGRRWEALAQWWRCPKAYFPLYQATLLLLTMIPFKPPRNLRPAFLRPGGIGSSPLAWVEGKGGHSLKEKSPGS